MIRTVSPELAAQLLAGVDPGRVHRGLAVGLRDGAVLAMAAAGLSPAEIATLRADQVRFEGGRVVVVLEDVIPWSGALPVPLGARLMAWLAERRAWNEPVPVILNAEGKAVSVLGIRKTLLRYAQESDRA